MIHIVKKSQILFVIFNLTLLEKKLIVNVKICLGKRNVEYEIVIPEPDLHFRFDHDGGQLRDWHHLHALQGREPKGNDKKVI